MPKKTGTFWKFFGGKNFILLHVWDKRVDCPLAKFGLAPIHPHPFTETSWIHAIPLPVWPPKKKLFLGHLGVFHQPAKSHLRVTGGGVRENAPRVCLRCVRVGVWVSGWMGMMHSSELCATGGCELPPGTSASAQAMRCLERGMGWCRKRQAMMRITAGDYVPLLTPVNLREFGESLLQGRNLACGQVVAYLPASFLSYFCVVFVCRICLSYFCVVFCIPTFAPSFNMGPAK